MASVHPNGLEHVRLRTRSPRGDTYASSLVPSLSSGAGAGRRAWYPPFTHASNFRHVTSHFNARCRILSCILRGMTESYGLDNGYDDITSVGGGSTRWI